MIKIGLTGSIGSGKSALGRMANKRLGIPVFDADKFVGELYLRNEELKAFLVRKCGNEVIQNGEVNRSVLKAIMQDVSQRETWHEIEAEVDRLVWVRYEEFVAEQEAAGKNVVIADVPFLFERNAQSRFDCTVNVYLPYEQQKQRALERAVPKLTEDDFKIRYAAFLPIEQRKHIADFNIDNSGEIEASLLQLRRHISKMRDRDGIRDCTASFNDAAVYVGSFDPFTLGHLDVVKSATKMRFPKFYIAIGINPEKKHPMFSVEERMAMIERELDRDVRPYLREGQEIIVTSYEGLTVDFMRTVGSSFCVRGVRGTADIELEGNLAAANRGLYADALRGAGATFTQAYFVTADPALRHVSSSFARAVCLDEGRDIALLDYVSADVAAKMIAKRERKKIMSKTYRIPTPEELESLESTWKKFVPDSDEADRVYEDLITKYSEPHRAYHNVGHLIELFECFLEYEDKLENPQAVALALFFHDVIYDVPLSDNEDQSAEYARNALAKLNIAPPIISRVTNLIEMTKTHQVMGEDLDASFMLDMDMAVLGITPEQYARYYQAIELEYCTHFMRDEYTRERIQYLTSIQQGSFFLTDDFKKRYSGQARKNIAGELLQLRERLAPKAAPHY